MGDDPKWSTSEGTPDTTSSGSFTPAPTRGGRPDKVDDTLSYGKMRGVPAAMAVRKPSNSSKAQRVGSYRVPGINTQVHSMVFNASDEDSDQAQSDSASEESTAAADAEEGRRLCREAITRREEQIATRRQATAKASAEASAPSAPTSSDNREVDGEPGTAGCGQQANSKLHTVPVRASSSPSSPQQAARVPFLRRAGA